MCNAYALASEHLFKGNDNDAGCER